MGPSPLGQGEGIGPTAANEGGSVEHQDIPKRYSTIIPDCLHAKRVTKTGSVMRNKARTVTETGRRSGLATVGGSDLGCHAVGLMGTRAEVFGGWWALGSGDESHSHSPLCCPCGVQARRQLSQRGEAHCLSFSLLHHHPLTHTSTQ